MRSPPFWGELCILLNTFLVSVGNCAAQLPLGRIVRVAAAMSVAIDERANCYFFALSAQRKLSEKANVADDSKLPVETCCGLRAGKGDVGEL